MSETKRLWAPWRNAYIAQMRHGSSRCIFCAAKRTRDDRAAYVVYRGKRVFALLNRYPYNAGHVMIAPYRHVGDLRAITAAEGAELFQAAQRMVDVLAKALKPHGLNLGVNIGRLAGAGIPDHLHLHIVPRWSGDTNFMPVLGGAKIISDSLEALYTRMIRLRP